MSALTATGLGLRYPAQRHWAVDDVSLTLRAGEITWLTGALGSGTSTLLLLLAGLAPRLTGGERRGTLRLDGADPANLAPLQHGIGYLGATPALQLSGIGRTVRDEVAIGPMNLGWPVARIRDAVTEALERLGVGHLGDRAPTALSGGEQQRVLLAALAVTAPQLWLLDEPFSALDRDARAHVQRWLGSLARDGCTVVIACDDAEAMRGVADRVVVLQRGRITLDGDPETLLASPAFAECGAATTEAATLAREAGLEAPYPLDTATLLSRIGVGAPLIPAVPHDRGDAASAPHLALDEVHFAYPGGPPVLAGISLGVRAGEAVGLFGSNGAGKSTLLRLAMALDHPGRGSVTTLGRATTGRHPEDFAPAAGFLFQQPERQLFASSVRAECAVGPRLAGWDRGRVEEAVHGVLAELGLEEVADEHPFDLPLPRRRLVALAAVLATDPALLLLDEPTAALDGASRDRVAEVVRRRAARGTAVLAITHDPNFAHEALDRGIVLGNGRIARDAPMREVLAAPGWHPPTTLAAALALGLPAGGDRRGEVAAAISRRQFR